jgi:hypothetical protein
MEACKHGLADRLIAIDRGFLDRAHFFTRQPHIRRHLLGLGARADSDGVDCSPPQVGTARFSASPRPDMGPLTFSDDEEG